MELSYIRQGGRAVAELTGPEPVLTDAQSALELAMTARYAAGANRLLVDKAAVAEDFFILSTGLGGDPPEVRQLPGEDGRLRGFFPLHQQAPPGLYL